MENPRGAYVPPSHHATAFNCPNCGAYAYQQWYTLSYGGAHVRNGWERSFCTHCKNDALWVDGRLVEPPVGVGPAPHPDLPEDVATSYGEAQSIASRSPRGAAALLRLGLQQLMPHLGQKGKDLDADIGKLVENGLPVQLQQAADALRVIGNNAVHPGQMSFEDNDETVTGLFELVNLIVDRLIAEPRRIEQLYSKLPKTALEHIEERDKGRNGA